MAVRCVSVRRTDGLAKAPANQLKPNVNLGLYSKIKMERIVPALLKVSEFVNAPMRLAQAQTVDASKMDVGGAMSHRPQALTVTRTVNVEWVSASRHCVMVLITKLAARDQIKIVFENSRTPAHASTQSANF